MLKWCEKHVKQLVGCSMVAIIVIIGSKHELILTYGS